MAMRRDIATSLGAVRIRGGHAGSARDRAPKSVRRGNRRAWNRLMLLPCVARVAHARVRYTVSSRALDTERDLAIPDSGARGGWYRTSAPERESACPHRIRSYFPAYVRASSPLILLDPLGETPGLRDLGECSRLGGSHTRRWDNLKPWCALKTGNEIEDFHASNGIILVILHLYFFHLTSNPLRTNRNLNKSPFHIYFSFKDPFGFFFFLLTFTVIILQYPYIFNDPDNFMPTNPISTPIHIQPEGWR